MTRALARRVAFLALALVLIVGSGLLRERWREVPPAYSPPVAMGPWYEPAPDAANEPTLGGRITANAAHIEVPPSDPIEDMMTALDRHAHASSENGLDVAAAGGGERDVQMAAKFTNEAIGAGGGGGGLFGGRLGGRINLAKRGGGGGDPDPAPRGRYRDVGESGFVETRTAPESTVALETDTASYAVVRQQIAEGRLPTPDMVRLEELVNSFRYAYRQPDEGVPFSVDIEVTGCPWEPTHRIARVGLATAPPPTPEQRPPANLVLLIDVSGSMQSSQRLPLILDGVRAMVPCLGPRDRVAIVVYAGAAGVVLPSTPATDTRAITTALDRLHAGGRTAGAAGLVLAYRVALAAFIPGGINRVVLCTDGDFNVGVTGPNAIIALAQEYVAKRIFLTVLGVGDGGNVNDALLEAISNRCDGHYAFLDGAHEARRVLVEQLSGTLLTVAKDVKLQIRFDPARVRSYRLLGYENRRLADRDFSDDTKDAGEIGAGHTATALYELVSVAGVPTNRSSPILRARLRYKLPGSDTSSLLEQDVVDRGAGYAEASGETQLALAVAELALALRRSTQTPKASLDAAHELAKAAVARFEDGRPPADLEQRDALVALIARAKALAAR